MPIGAGITQKQSGGMVPEHILGKSVLKMNLQELQEFVQTELDENPALSLSEDRVCPVCGSDLVGNVCATCGSSVIEDNGESEGDTDWQDDSWPVDEAQNDSYLEPFVAVATPCSLTDHLMEQIRTNIRAEDIHIAEFIVDCLDEDGYLREPMFDMSKRFGLSVPELESVLSQIQSMDPPGIAARSLQECLLIQLRQLDVDSEEKNNTAVIISEHWESVSRMKLDEIARKMGIEKEKVSAALRFIRECLNPHPASMFRDPWQTITPRREAKLAPDVVFRETELGMVAEVVDPVSNRIDIDEVYAALHAEMSRKKNGFSDQDRARVKESVTNAKALIEALEFRRSALRTVSEELLRRQEEFFTNGPAHLKPMTKKQLAQFVGLHESTVCRATENKSMRLPTGEVMPLDVLFDSALPVKELVRKLTAERVNGRPLSDGEIAERLQSMGIQIARRTVAKYRDQLRLPSADYRLS